MPTVESSSSKAISNMAVANGPVEMLAIFGSKLSPNESNVWEQQQRMRREEKRKWHEANGQMKLLAPKLRRPLKKLRSLLSSKRHRQAAMQFIRPEFRFYAEGCFRPQLPRKQPSPPKSSIKRLVTFNSSTFSATLDGPAKVWKARKGTVIGPASPQVVAIHRLYLRLLRRSLQWRPLLPRLPVFLCPKCGLTSRHFQMLKDHICGRRMVDYKNVAQTVELGFRSRVKDALAVLERHPRPQALRVTRLGARYSQSQGSSHNLLDQWAGSQIQALLNRQPKTLFEIAWHAVQRVHRLDYNCTRVKTVAASNTSATDPTHSTYPATDHDYLGGQKELPQSSGRALAQASATPTSFHPKRGGAMPKPSISFVPFGNERRKSTILEAEDESKNKEELAKERQPGHEEGGLGQLQRQKEREIVTASSDGDAVFCRLCGHLFARYTDWDEHLYDPEGAELGCTSNGSMRIQVTFGERFPSTGRQIPDFKSLTMAPKSLQTPAQEVVRLRWRCTKCSARQFLSRADFHAHLLKCAMARQNNRLVEGGVVNAGAGSNKEAGQPPALNGWTAVKNGAHGHGEQEMRRRRKEEEEAAK